MLFLGHIFRESHKVIFLLTRGYKHQCANRLQGQMSKFDQSEQTIFRIYCNEVCSYVELSFHCTVSQVLHRETDFCFKKPRAPYSLKKNFHIAVGVFETVLLGRSQWCYSHLHQSETVLLQEGQRLLQSLLQTRSECVALNKLSRPLFSGTPHKSAYISLSTFCHLLLMSILEIK